MEQDEPHGNTTPRNSMISTFHHWAKTGTTQGSQRMAFIGMVPSEYAGQWSLDEGYVMASYIGYDTPTTIRGSGGSAKLPFWLQTAQSRLSDNGNLGSLERPVP